MPPTDRYRHKRTVYFSDADDEAIETVRRASGLRTKASAIRRAVWDAERACTRTPAETAVRELIAFAESLTMIPPADERQLLALCREAKKEIGM